jgi:hypothetical protein
MPILNLNISFYENLRRPCIIANYYSGVSIQEVLTEKKVTLAPRNSRPLSLSIPTWWSARVLNSRKTIPGEMESPAEIKLTLD